MIFRKDRDSRGGGVFLAVHNSIPSRLIPSPPSLEVVAVEILLPHPVVLSVTYIPPGAPVSSISSTIHFLSNLVNQHNTILLGDFNLPDINWENLSSATPSGNMFCEFVFEHTLHQFVDSPTHIKGNTLDLVLCKSLDQVADVSIGSHEPFIGLRSDHRFINVTIPCNPINTTRPSATQFIFAKGDYEGLNNHFELADFSVFHGTTDIEAKWTFLKSLILEGCGMFIPKSKSTMSNYPRWFNGEIINMLHKIKSLKKKVRLNSSSVNNVLTLKTPEHQLSSKVSSSKLEYESRLVSDFASKSNNHIYKYISSFTKQSSLPSSLHLESQTESSNFGVRCLYL